MAKFIASTFTLALVVALSGALYLTIGAYNMPMGDRYTCNGGTNGSATCMTALLLDTYTSN